VSTRNNILGLIFLAAVLAFAVFAAKRLVFSPPRPGSIAALLEKGRPAPKPLPKPSAAVTAPPSATASSGAPASAAPSSTPSSNGKEQASAPAAGAVASSKKEPSPAAGATAPEDHRPQLRLEAGVRLWIRVTAINRKPDGSFSFRGTLLQPVTLANRNQLDQGTELAGSGTVNNGHVAVLVKDFTVGGANYALRQDDASGSNKRPGTGLAVELDPGKLLEVWLASSSVYRKTPSK
jgi:hypothetical protein